MDSVIASVAAWGATEWARVIAILALMGLDGRNGWRFAPWVWRRGKPPAVEPLPVVIHPSPAPPPPPRPPPLIGLPDAVTVLGRADDVAAIRARLTAAPDQPLALVNSGAGLAGQGGIGKTTLARHTITRHGAADDGVLWMLATTRQNLIDGLCAAAPALGLPPLPRPREPDAKAVAAAIAARGATAGRPWLIGLDTLEDRADLDRLLPPGAHRLVITRQGTGWAGWSVPETDVPDFATPDAPAMRLLMDHASRDHDPRRRPRPGKGSGRPAAGADRHGRLAATRARALPRGAPGWPKCRTAHPQLRRPRFAAGGAAPQLRPAARRRPGAGAPPVLLGGRGAGPRAAAGRAAG